MWARKHGKRRNDVEVIGERVNPRDGSIIPIVRWRKAESFLTKKRFAFREGRIVQIAGEKEGTESTAPKKALEMFEDIQEKT